MMVFAMIAFSLVGYGCGVWPRFEIEAAKMATPQVRQYALDNQSNLTPDEREPIRTTEPQIGHANYVVYYFVWRDGKGKQVVGVETEPPPCEPIRIWQAKEENYPVLRKSHE